MSSSTDDVETLDSPPRKRVKQHLPKAVKVEWSDEDGEDVGAAAYRKFKARKPEERKRAIAIAKKAKAREARVREREDGTSTGVGKRAPRSKQKKEKAYNEVSSDDDLMEWTTPDYVQDRRKGFDQRYRKLQEGGLQLAPTYADIEFSEEEGDNLRYVQEKPDHITTTTLAPYKDIELPYSAGVVPAPIAQYLRDYQVRGAAFLHELFVYQRGGILGDDMGLGKTIQVIAFLTAVYGKTGDERDRKRMRKMRRAGRWYPKTLIICPGSLMANWKDELDRWGWWHVDIFHGSVKEKDSVLASAKSGMIEIMITTYTTYRRNKGPINLVEWDCVIADECHVIKERKSEITKAMNEMNALCRVGLTGTAIQNKYEELWTLLNWTNPGRFGPISVWKAQVSEPLRLGQSHDATVIELARARETARKLVENLLPQFFLRRMKSLIKDQLPKKSDRVVFCPLTETQASGYENFLESEMVQFIKNANDLCSCGSKKKSGWCHNQFLEDGSTWQTWVFPAMQTLQKLSNHLALLIPQSNDTKDRQAKDLEYLTIAVPDTWKQLYTTRDSMIHRGNPEYCGKWRILRKLLRFWYEEGGNKVLVFSHSVRLLQMLQRLFDGTESRYNVAYLDGSMKYEDRYATVQSFNADPTQFVFLISTKAGGVGLNITSANKVVIVDPNWNPSYDLQAQDRAYRIGQTRDVEVYRLVSQGTIEEVVYARQIYKQQQANIGYTGSNERRYFQGVQDRKDQKGEIFGLKNLFAYENENVRLRDIVNKTNVAESKAGVHFHKLTVEDQIIPLESTDVDNAGLPTPDNEDAAMSQLAAQIKGEDDEQGQQRKKYGRGSSSANISFMSDASINAQRHDPVQAILASAGVSYTHENSEVIGSSRIEAQLSKQAAAAGLGYEDQNARVFADNSQTKTQLHGFNRDKQGNAIVVGNDVNIRGQTIKYKYRPPIDIQRRQFCSMAMWAGYGNSAEAVISFALYVESCTQAERREILDRFYLWRKDALEDSNLDVPGQDDLDITKQKQLKTNRKEYLFEPGTKILKEGEPSLSPVMTDQLRPIVVDGTDNEDDEL